MKLANTFLGILTLGLLSVWHLPAQTQELSEADILLLVNNDPPVASQNAKGFKQRGPDGVEVFVPMGWFTNISPDQRLVAIPPGGYGYTSADRRIVAIPKGWNVAVGADGRGAAIPPGGFPQQGLDRRMVGIPKGWRGQQGTDGRVVAIPPGKNAVPNQQGRLEVK